MSMKSKLFIILILCFFLNGCWLFEGYYGPFKVKIVTQDGGQIKDVFLTLVSILPGGFIQGTTHSYKETLIVKSGVIIEFPRGFVQRVGDHRATLGIIISASHPHYEQYSTEYLSLPNNPKGVIELVNVVMKKSIYLDPNYLEKRAREKLKRGQTITIQEGIRTSKYFSHYYDCSNYFSEAVKLGRRDLVEKYMLPHIADIASDNSPEAKELAAEYKKECNEEIEHFTRSWWGKT